MQHRMCIVGSKAKTEGSSLRDYWYRASLDSSGPVTCQAQGRGAARLGGQGGAHGRGGGAKTQKRIRSDVESCAGTSGAGRAAGLLADDIVIRLRPRLTFLSILFLLFLFFLFFLFFLSFLSPLLLSSLLSFLL